MYEATPPRSWNTWGNPFCNPPYKTTPPYPTTTGTTGVYSPIWKDYAKGLTDEQKVAKLRIEREEAERLKKVSNEVAGIKALANPPPRGPVDQKVKSAQGKPPLAMVPLRALVGPSRVYAYGGKKYAPGNHYTATMPDAGPRYISAALRHLMAMQHPNGTHLRETISALDEESGLPHIDHAICSLLMLRSIVTKHNWLPVDPGEGKEPK